MNSPAPGSNCCAGRWGWVTLAAATALWDDDGFRAILTSHLKIIRDAGALDRLPI
jgi:hypothetical protein